jgi:hypothetical protein
MMKEMNNMIKVTDKMLKRFLEIMDENDEFLFGDEEDIKQQLQVCLNTQGYWSGCTIRVYWDKDIKDFRIGSRF